MTAWVAQWWSAVTTALFGFNLWLVCQPPGSSWHRYGWLCCIAMCGWNTFAIWCMRYERKVQDSVQRLTMKKRVPWAGPWNSDYDE